MLVALFRFFVPQFYFKILPLIYVYYSNYNFATDGFSAMASAGNVGGLSPSSLKGNVDWQRKLALRYRRIREVYETYCSNVEGKVIKTY
jgi:hypothetical protein